MYKSFPLHSIISSHTLRMYFCYSLPLALSMSYSLALGELYDYLKTGIVDFAASEERGTENKSCDLS